MPPGFEALASAELDEKFPELSRTQLEEKRTLIRGGLELNVSDDVVPELHYRLKIPTSLRERLYEFKSRDFLRLFNKIQSLPWCEHVIGDAFDLSVTAEKSRLGNERRIAETVSDGIRRYFSKQPPKKPTAPYTQLIYVRMFNDICTISRELTGPALYQRGYKEMAAIAPLRENLAAGLFYSLWDECEGFDVLMDPMCGSGTFLSEAWLFWRDLRSLSSVRDFAFVHDKRWSQLEMSGATVGVPAVANLGPNNRGPTKFFGFDRDERSLKAARMSASNLSAPVSFTEGDVFSDRFTKQFVEIKNAGQPIAFIVNPPYGERIRLPMAPGKYYPLLIERLATLASANTKGIGVVIPKAHCHHIKKSVGGFQLARTLDFLNGGLEVQFQIFTPKKSN